MREMISEVLSSVLEMKLTRKTTDEMNGDFMVSTTTDVEYTKKWKPKSRKVEMQIKNKEEKILQESVEETVFTTNNYGDITGEKTTFDLGVTTQEKQTKYTTSYDKDNKRLLSRIGEIMGSKPSGDLIPMTYREGITYDEYGNRKVIIRDLIPATTTVLDDSFYDCKMYIIEYDDENLPTAVDVIKTNGKHDYDVERYKINRATTFDFSIESIKRVGAPETEGEFFTEYEDGTVKVIAVDTDSEGVVTAMSEINFVKMI